jgi:DNA-binding NarL/FixJ family response regulator
LEHAALLAQGLTNVAIAKRMKCSLGYIRNKTSLLYAKLGLCKWTAGNDMDPRILLAVRYDRELGREEGA